MTDLKPCPNCGMKPRPYTLDIVFVNNGKDPDKSVMACGRCRFSVPQERTYKGTFAAWNAQPREESPDER